MRTLKILVKKLLGLILFRPLTEPSEEERTFLSELQTRFRELPVWEGTNVSPSEAMWFSNMKRLREMVLNEDPRCFLRWDVVSETMFVVYAPYINTELKYLRQHPGWTTCWQPAIRESTVGNPIPYMFYPASSANLIHHAYHLAQFEESTRTRVRDMDFVFEFGGGYGSMCRLFHNLGFHGTYVIFDLPPFSALQSYYLKTLGLPVISGLDTAKSKGGIVCISNLQEVENRLMGCRERIEGQHSLFVATWSLSESPVDVRNRIDSLVHAFEFFLIAYQDKFGEVDNVFFFKKWIDDHPHHVWASWPLRHMGNRHYYLVGKANYDR